MSIPSGKLSGDESASERQSRCIKESQMKFFTTAATIGGGLGITGYLAEQSLPAFRSIPLPAKLIGVAVATLGPSYWVSEKHMMRCHRPDYETGRKWA